jgi:hypothetical protein
MEMFYQFGLTQRALEGIIIFGGAAALLAIFWRLIVIGGGIILVAYIFMHHQLEPVDPVVQAQSQKQEFMQDCMGIAMNDKDHCELIWNERMIEERKLNDSVENRTSI